MNDQIIICGEVDFMFSVHYTVNSLLHRHGYRKVLPVLLK